MPLYASHTALYLLVFLYTSCSPVSSCSSSCSSCTHLPFLLLKKFTCTICYHLYTCNSSKNIWLGLAGGGGERLRVGLMVTFVFYLMTIRGIKYYVISSCITAHMVTKNSLDLQQKITQNKQKLFYFYFFKLKNFFILFCKTLYTKVLTNAHIQRLFIGYIKAIKKRLYISPFYSLLV